MFLDLEARGRNWHNELPSVLWALQSNVNRATRGTPFNLVYGADVVLPPEKPSGSFLGLIVISH
jgi:hypothetical protein